MSRALSLGFIPPQLPTLTDQPPEGADWIHEVKHDGYRTILVIERSTARAYTRNGHDWSDRYPGIIAGARKLSCKTAIFDCEVIVQDARGVSDLEALQAALRSVIHPLCPIGSLTATSFLERKITNMTDRRFAHH